MKRFVVSGLIACAILAATVYGQNSGDTQPAAPKTDSGQAASQQAAAPKADTGESTSPAAAPKTDSGQATSQPASTHAPFEGLKDAYAGKFLIGTAADLRGFSDAELANIKANYNIITPENCMKPQPIHPSENTYNWTTSDALVQWCQDNNIKVWGHTLCWHSQVGPWFFQPGADGQPVTRELVMERLKNHIMTVVGHYKGRVMGWDVVNEAINDGGSSETENLRNTNWLRLIGPDFLTLAFKWAHEADPEAQLYYNDYSIEHNAVQGTGKFANSMLLLKRLIKEGAPINGVGIQGHWSMSPSIADVEKAIIDYESLGLKVSISEMDVAVSGANSGAMPTGGRGGGTLSDDAFKRQAEVYAKLFDVFNRHAKTISRVTFWGINDRRSWRSGQSPLVFDAQLQPKPAYQAIIDVAEGKNVITQP
jgi:endo-1,4-beta-xylanase